MCSQNRLSFDLGKWLHHNLKLHRSELQAPLLENGKNISLLLLHTAHCVVDLAVHKLVEVLKKNILLPLNGFLHLVRGLASVLHIFNFVNRLGVYWVESNGFRLY